MSIMSFHSTRSRCQLIWVLLTLAAFTSAQTNKVFQWQFGNNALSNSLPTCLPLAIIAKPFTAGNVTNGTPPFYMISFAVEGTPQTTLIGTDPNNLSWTVTHAPGTQLLLQVVDANGSAGGLPPQIFNVVAGQTTQCVITPDISPPFSVSANVTGRDQLSTCQPWGLTITGGVPPYNLTLVQPNSPITTNVSIARGDDAFTYINRANPGSQLLAAISDLTGRWATGTPLVNTIANDLDPACTGLVSSGGNSTQIAQQAQQAAALRKEASRQRATAIAVSLTLIFLALGCLVVSFYIFRVRRHKRRALEQEERKPRQYVVGEQDIHKGDLESGPPVILSITRFLDSDDDNAHTPQSKRSLKNSCRVFSPTDTATTGSPTSHITVGTQEGNGEARRSDRFVKLSTPRPKGHIRTSSFSTFPTRSIRVPSKIMAAGLAPVREAQTPSSNASIREPPPPPYAPESRHGRSYSR